MSTPFAIERLTSAERIALCIDIVQARGRENARRSDKMIGSGWHEKLERQDLVERYIGYMSDTELDESTFEKHLRRWALILSSDERTEYKSLKKKKRLHPDVQNRFNCLQALHDDENKPAERLNILRNALDATPLIAAPGTPSPYESRGEREVPDDGSFGQAEGFSTLKSDETRQDSLFENAPPKRKVEPRKKRSGKKSLNYEEYAGSTGVSEDYGPLTEEPEQYEYGPCPSSHAAHSKGPSRMDGRAYTMPHREPVSFAPPSHQWKAQSNYVPSYDAGYNAREHFSPRLGASFRVQPQSRSSLPSAFTASFTVPGKTYSTRPTSYSAAGPSPRPSYGGYQ